MTKDELQEKYPPTIVDIQGVGIVEVYTPKEVTAIINDLFAKRIVGVTLPTEVDLLDWVLDKVEDKRIELNDKLTDEMLKEITQAYIDCHQWIKNNGN